MTDINTHNYFLGEKRKVTSNWFAELRNHMCKNFELIEQEYLDSGGKIYLTDQSANKFHSKTWERDNENCGKDLGGGEMSLLRGNVFEKMAVNISTVYGEFSEEFSKKIPGTENSKEFFATGISVIAHPYSPLVPAMHFNTRYIKTSKSWFGGGADLTPNIEDNNDKNKFHDELKNICDKYNPNYYSQFKKECDEYFYLKHRKEPRGIGGIFFDYIDSDESNFDFIKDLGICLTKTYSEIVRQKMLQSWSDEQKEIQLKKRGRYVEFNLLYDRGTKFGLETGGNVEAILMSLPPVVKW